MQLAQPGAALAGITNNPPRLKEFAAAVVQR